jgi:hypothetical protein
LLLSLQHRLSHNFTILANYTWSHCIADPVTLILGGSYTNPSSRRYDRGNCGGIDIRHLLNVSGVFESPKFSNRVVEIIAGNWQLAPIFGWHTGAPFIVSTGVDNALNNIGGQRPNLLTPDANCAVQGPNCWINASAFAAPATGTFGNLGNNSLIGPGYVQIDLSVSRRVVLHERHTLEFRLDIFNVLNHVNFSTPVTTMTASNFGHITSDITAPGSSSGDPRILQISAKYAF